MKSSLLEVRRIATTPRKKVEAWWSKEERNWLLYPRTATISWFRESDTFLNQSIPAYLQSPSRFRLLDYCSCLFSLYLLKHWLILALGTSSRAQSPKSTLFQAQAGSFHPRLKFPMPTYQRISVTNPLSLLSSIQYHETHDVLFYDVPPSLSPTSSYPAPVVRASHSLPMFHQDFPFFRRLVFCRSSSLLWK